MQIGEENMNFDIFFLHSIELHDRLIGLGFRGFGINCIIYFLSVYFAFFSLAKAQSALKKECKQNDH